METDRSVSTEDDSDNQFLIRRNSIRLSLTNSPIHWQSKTNLPIKCQSYANPLRTFAQWNMNFDDLMPNHDQSLANPPILDQSANPPIMDLSANLWPVFQRQSANPRSAKHRASNSPNKPVRTSIKTVLRPIGSALAHVMIILCQSEDHYRQ